MRNQLQYNKLTLALVVVGLCVTSFLPVLPISGQAAAALLTFLAGLNGVAQKYMAPPPRNPDDPSGPTGGTGGTGGDGARTRITAMTSSDPPSAAFAVACRAVTFAVVMGALVVLAGCTPAARAGLPVISEIDAVGQKVANVLGWCEEHLPGDEPDLVSKLVAARKAYDERDYGYALALGQELLEAFARKGEVAPRDIVADRVLGAMAAHGIEQGMRALDGRDSEGNLKKRSGPDGDGGAS